MRHVKGLLILIRSKRYARKHKFEKVLIKLRVRRYFFFQTIVQHFGRYEAIRSNILTGTRVVF